MLSRPGPVNAAHVVGELAARHQRIVAAVPERVAVLEQRQIGKHRQHRHTKLGLDIVVLVHQLRHRRLVGKLERLGEVARRVRGQLTRVAQVVLLAAVDKHAGAGRVGDVAAKVAHRLEAQHPLGTHQLLAKAGRAQRHREPEAERAADGAIVEEVVVRVRDPVARRLGVGAEQRVLERLHDEIVGDDVVLLVAVLDEHAVALGRKHVLPRPAASVCRAR
jgi:hypothetical protein